MKEFKGTKGEWSYKIEDCRIIFDNPNMDLWFKMPDNYFANSRQEVKANAKLIAAAPDLLEACKIAYNLCDKLRMPTEDEVQALKVDLQKAIEKALSWKHQEKK